MTFYPVPEGTDPEVVTALSDAGALRRTADKQRSQPELLINNTKEKRKKYR